MKTDGNVEGSGSRARVRGQAGKRTATHWLTVASLLIAAPLGAQDDADRVQEIAPGKEVIKAVPLPWFLASSDIGVGPLVAVVLTAEDGRVQPYNYQAVVVAARSNLGFENYAFKYDRVNFTSWNLRLKVTAGYVRNLVDHYFGYGNYHDLDWENRVAAGETPVGSNVNASPDLIQGEEVSLNRNGLLDPGHALNPGRRYLRETQNQYFQFDSVQRAGRVSVEKRLGATPWSLKVGVEAGAYRALSYRGDMENNNTLPNIPTLLDLERPVGYEGTQQMRYINFGEVGIHYDTRPVDREMHPDRGIFAGVKLEGSGDAVGSDYTFARAHAFAHIFASPFQSFLNNHDMELTLAGRGLASESFGQVPFFFAQGLGSRTLRGYPDRQFMDRVMAMAGVEAQLTFARTEGADFILFVFAENGRVAGEWRGMDSSGWHRAAGGGLDVFIGGNTIIELVAGRSRFKDHFEVSIGHTFLME